MTLKLYISKNLHFNCVFFQLIIDLFICETLAFKYLQLRIFKRMLYSVDLSFNITYSLWFKVQVFAKMFITKNEILALQLFLLIQDDNFQDLASDTKTSNTMSMQCRFDSQGKLISTRRLFWCK